jgi:3-hydroxyethyl bacteriochlorophyllide a dehydrogenase
MDTLAVVLQEPRRIELAALDMTPPGEGDVVVDVAWSGISTGTERLLWSGRMPAFPGMGYPLVPGYETVGRIAEAAPGSGRRAGELVFVPGARCFGPVRSLFGGAAARLVTPAARTFSIDAGLGQSGVLLALAATACNALPAEDQPQPDLIVGHGVVGRLLARLACLRGAAPTVWESQAARRDGGAAYRVIDPAEDERRDYRCIVDASGDAGLLDTLIGRLAPGGEVVLAGFYDRLSFAFPPAFMREARLRVAAEWREPALLAVRALIDAGRLSLDGLITHVRPARDAGGAYDTAFAGGDCLKMVLDWSSCA